MVTTEISNYKLLDKNIELKDVWRVPASPWRCSSTLGEITRGKIFMARALQGTPYIWTWREYKNQCILLFNFNLTAFCLFVTFFLRFSFLLKCWKIEDSIKVWNNFMVYLLDVEIFEEVFWKVVCKDIL